MTTTIVQQATGEVDLDEATFTIPFEDTPQPGNTLIVVIEAEYDGNTHWDQPLAPPVTFAPDEPFSGGDTAISWVPLPVINSGVGRTVEIAAARSAGEPDQLVFTVGSLPFPSETPCIVAVHAFELSSTLGDVFPFIIGEADSGSGAAVEVDQWVSTFTGYAKNALQIVITGRPIGEADPPTFTGMSSPSPSRVEFDNVAISFREAPPTGGSYSINDYEGEGAPWIAGLTGIIPQSRYSTEQSVQASSSSITIAPPTAENLLILTARSTSALTLSGWSKIQKERDDGGLFSTVFWKEAGVGESTALTVSGASHLWFMEVSGFDRAPTALKFVKTDYSMDRTGHTEDDEWMKEHGGSTTMPDGVPGDDAYFFATLSYQAIQSASILLPDLAPKLNVRMHAAGDGWDFYPGYPFPVAILGGVEAGVSLDDAVGVGILFINDPDAPLDGDEPEPEPEPDTNEYTFPDESQRLMFNPSGAFGRPLLNTAGTGLTVYIDDEATQLAGITELDSSEIEDSRLIVDGNSMIPLFKGPEGVTRLYIKVDGSPRITEITASTPEQLDWLRENGVGGTPSTPGEGGPVELLPAPISRNVPYGVWRQGGRAVATQPAGGTGKASLILGGGPALIAPMEYGPILDMNGLSNLRMSLVGLAIPLSEGALSPSDVLITPTFTARDQLQVEDPEFIEGETIVFEVEVLEGQTGFFDIDPVGGEFTLPDVEDLVLVGLEVNQVDRGTTDPVQGAGFAMASLSLYEGTTTLVPRLTLTPNSAVGLDDAHAGSFNVDAGILFGQQTMRLDPEKLEWRIHGESGDVADSIAIAPAFGDGTTHIQIPRLRVANVPTTSTGVVRKLELDTLAQAVSAVAQDVADLDEIVSGLGEAGFSPVIPTQQNADINFNDDLASTAEIPCVTMLVEIQNATDEPSSHSLTIVNPGALKFARVPINVTQRSGNNMELTLPNYASGSFNFSSGYGDRVYEYEILIVGQGTQGQGSPLSALLSPLLRTRLVLPKSVLGVRIIPNDTPVDTGDFTEFGLADPDGSVAGMVSRTGRGGMHALLIGGPNSGRWVMTETGPCISVGAPIAGEIIVALHHSDVASNYLLVPNVNYDGGYTTQAINGGYLWMNRP